MIIALVQKNVSVECIIFFSFSGPYSWFQSLKSWLLRKLLNYMFPHGILYHPGQIQVLERCSKSKAPFLFLPVHKSSLDSIVIKSVLEKTPSRHDLKTFLADHCRILVDLSGLFYKCLDLTNLIF